MKNILKILVLLSIISCTKEEETVVYEPKLIIKIEVDSNQERLNNLGQPAGIVAGNAGQNPIFNKISTIFQVLKHKIRIH